MKKLIVTILCLAAFGCTKDPVTGKWSMSPATKAKFSATAKELGQAAVKIAQNTVDRFATTELDALLKNNFQQSSGDLLRALENSAITAGTAEIAPTITAQLERWLPDKTHWQNYATQIAQLVDGYVKAHPNDPNAANVALETVATYLNSKPPATTIQPVPTPSPSTVSNGP